MQYNFRAECIMDVYNFLMSDIPISSYNINSPLSLDCYVNFSTNKTLKEIKKELRKIDDSHVMLRTIQRIN
jgi:hypothetical protein